MSLSATMWVLGGAQSALHLYSYQKTTQTRVRGNKRVQKIFFRNLQVPLDSLVRGLATRA